MNEHIPVYTTADILVLPSYREGFNNVVLEAAAMELPVVASDVIGCRGAVLDGVTGLFTPLADAETLAQTLSKLIEDAPLRHKLGRNGRQRIEKEFRQEYVWQGIVEQYQKLMEVS